MARFQNLHVNKLSANEIRSAGNSSLITFRDLTVVAGENATTALSQQTTLPFNAYGNDQFVLGATVNATPFRVIASALSEVALLTGTTVGNMASTDRIVVATTGKGGPAGLDIVKAGTATGTASASSITVSDPVITADCYAFGQVRVTANGSCTVNKMVCTAGVLTITMSGTMTASHTVDYVVVRRIGLGKPSHYIAVMSSGALAAVGAGVSDTIVATGVKAGDIMLMTPLTQTETDHYLLGTVPSADLLTLTFQGAPGVTTLGYLAIRPIL